MFKANKIEGGVCAPKGFKASGIHAGLRKNKDKSDLALILADTKCSAAGVFTKNKVFAAPVGVTRSHLSFGYARAVICNSGNANACCDREYENAEATCKALAEKLGIDSEEVIVASTGVIGVPLPIEPLIKGIPTLIDSLAEGAEASDSAARAIMTTDTVKKEIAVSFEIGGKEVRMGGICKGSGMIHPNMGTMLCFLTTDAAVAPEMLKKALSAVCEETFNMVTVDGDTSTNDMMTIMASGHAGNKIIAEDGEDFDTFVAALSEVCTYLCKAIAADGEGASKLIECKLHGFSNRDGARTLAKSVVASSLVKAAMFGSDANWGRVLCALGYSGVEFDPDKVDVKFASEAGEISVCAAGHGLDFDEDAAKKILLEKKVVIDVNMNCGAVSATAWGCDLTYEYVHINGDYRS